MKRRDSQSPFAFVLFVVVQSHFRNYASHKATGVLSNYCKLSAYSARHYHAATQIDVISARLSMHKCIKISTKYASHICRASLSKSANHRSKSINWPFSNPAHAHHLQWKCDIYALQTICDNRTAQTTKVSIKSKVCTNNDILTE